MAIVQQTPSGGGGSGGGDKRGDDPSKGHYIGKGDVNAAVWLYSVRPARQYLMQWLARNADQLLTVEFLRQMAHFLWQLQAQGINLSDHWRLLAVHQDDEEAWLAPQFLRFTSNVPTVRSFFSLNSDRGLYDTNVEALLQQAAGSNRFFAGEEACRRCSNDRYARTFAQCAQSFYQGHVLNYGACNNCALNGNGQRCSFARRPEGYKQMYSSPSIEEVLATAAVTRPQHPEHPSPQSVRMRSRSNSAVSMTSAPGISPAHSRMSSLTLSPRGALAIRGGAPSTPRGRGRGSAVASPSGAAPSPMTALDNLLTGGSQRGNTTSPSSSD